MSEQLLAGQGVLVTGANRGIGFATCAALVANGATVWAGARTLDGGWIEDLVVASGASPDAIKPVHLDVTDEASVKSVLAVTKADETPLTGLVNNAGVIFNGLLQMTKQEVAQDVFATNFFGPMSLMQGTIRQMMRNRGGSIVNVSSTTAIDGNSGRSVYGASKAALSTLTKVAAREWGPYGVRVNAVAPGVTATEMLSSMTDEVITDVVGTTDLRRRGEPAEIAQAIMFLLSPLSAYVSGQVVRVDGGMRP